MGNIIRLAARLKIKTAFIHFHVVDLVFCFVTQIKKINIDKSNNIAMKKVKNIPVFLF